MIERANEERLDIVDEHDCIIGQSDRKTVHLQGLRHRAAHLIIYSESGQILLQKRSHLKDNFPNKWDSSVAGHVESGESYQACIRREMCEELGIFPNPTLCHIATLEANKSNGWEFVQIFCMQSEGPFVPCRDEIDEIRWIDLANLSEWLAKEPEAFAGGFLQIFEVFVTSKR